MTRKKEIRADFRCAVFTRANYCCEYCGKKGFDRQIGNHHSTGERVPLDAHHIQNRNLFLNGGYVKENGISLCDACHLKAEQLILGFLAEDLYPKIGSSYKKALVADRRNI